MVARSRAQAAISFIDFNLSREKRAFSAQPGRRGRLTLALSSISLIPHTLVFLPLTMLASAAGGECYVVEQYRRIGRPRTRAVRLLGIFLDKRARYGPAAGRA